MRILVLSNLYPPSYLGGYELACQDVVEGLMQRGHEMFVLTSTYNMSDAGEDRHISRSLHLNPYENPTLPIWRYAWNQIRNSRRLIHEIKRIQPELIYVWNMGRLEPSLKAILPVHSQVRRYRKSCREQLTPIVFAISDPWLLWKDCEYAHWNEYWEHIPNNDLKRWGKRFLRDMLSAYLFAHQVIPSIQYAHFFSNSLQRQYANNGVVAENHTVIYHGVPIEKYHKLSRENIHRKPHEIRCLYCGQIAKAKGVHTAIEGLAILHRKKNLSSITLTIVGPTPYSDYLYSLKRLIAKHQLSDKVIIRGKIAREQIGSLYNSHDVLLFPSIWEEPFSIVLLEAMAHGLAVVSTNTGGSSEILRHQENSLIFPAEDASALAGQLETLVGHPELMARLQSKAAETIRSSYSLENMVNQIEHYLTDVFKQQTSLL